MKNVLVVGSINMDMVITTPQIPEMGETIKGNEFNVVSGGKGANQAVAAARLGCPTKMIGAVGNDIYGSILKENLKNNQVDKSCVKICECSSGVAVITVFEGDNSIILHEGANKEVTIADIDKNIELLKWADIVLFQFEIPLETVLYAAKKAKENNTYVIVNSAPMLDFPKELLKYTDIFILNETESQLFTGIQLKNTSDIENSIKKIQKMGAENVIITMGKMGSYFNIGEEIFSQPIYKVNVVDTTAAGDSFIAGLASQIDLGIKKAVDYATKVSAITVSRMGAQTSLPTKQELNSFFKIN